MSIRSRRRGKNPDAGKLILTTGVLKDDQFSSPKQIRWASALGKLLVLNGGSTVNFQIRNADLSFSSKFFYTTSVTIGAIDSDISNIYTSVGGTGTFVRKWSHQFDLITSANILGNGGVRMIDASGDPDYIYVTSNNATDGHGVRKVRKSDMTVVASILATGAGDGQFNNPLGVKYYDGFVYVCDVTNARIVKLNALGANLTFDSNLSAGGNAFNDLDTDGTYWYGQGALRTFKRNMDFTVVSDSDVNNGYSLCIIPDQGDGYGATLAIVDNANSHLERRKCSDLSAINSVGSAGDGSSSLCDPVITGPAGTWRDSEGNSYAVASGANISKNGFSGDFFRQTPNRMTYQPTGRLSDITAIDANTDAIVGEIKNLRKCVNCTSYKLYGNPAYVVNLTDISSKATIVQIYSCGLGVIPADLSKCTSANDIRLQDNSWTQTQIDQFIQWIYAGRAGFTDAGRSMRIGLNNAAPSGTYTDPSVTPGNGSSNSDWSWDAGLGYHLPLTPNAMVWRLLHAVEGGVSSWASFTTA